MEHTYTEILDCKKHHWRNDLVSLYVKENTSGGTWQVELALLPNTEMKIIRLENTASREEAINYVACFLELFE